MIRHVGVRVCRPQNWIVAEPSMCAPVDRRRDVLRILNGHDAHRHTGHGRAVLEVLMPIVDGGIAYLTATDLREFADQMDMLDKVPTP